MDEQTNSPNGLNGQNPVSERSAEDYVNAVDVVADIVQLAIGVLPAGGTAMKVAQMAAKYVPLAQKAAHIIPEVSPIAKKAADSIQAVAPEALNNGAAMAAEAVQGAAGAIGDKVQVANNAIRSAIDAKAQEKARKEARRVLLDGAGIRMSSAQFIGNWDTQTKMGNQAENYLDYCGCYVLATYSAAVKKNDYSAFRDIYVGKSTSMGASIHDDIIGLGNPDVYADVKYKQHVYVLLFPCDSEKLDLLETSLVTALDADASYNAPKQAAQLLDDNDSEQDE